MTMQRARRLASVVVVASLGVAGLSACRSESSVAAYVGGSGRITTDRVDAVYNEVRDQLQASPPDAQAPDGQPVDGQPTPASSGPVTMPITRADVVSLLLGGGIVDKLAAAQGVAAPTEQDLQEAQLASALKLPANSEYAQLYAVWLFKVDALRAKVTTPGNPTDADLQELHDGLVAIQQYDPSTPFSKFKTDLAASANMSVVRQAAAVRDEIVKAGSQSDIRINPRYRPTKLPLLVTQDQRNGMIVPLITVPIGPQDQAAPVTDAR
jgi:hypothetical protein